MADRNPFCRAGDGVREDAGGLRLLNTGHPRGMVQNSYSRNSPNSAKPMAVCGTQRMSAPGPRGQKMTTASPAGATDVLVIQPSHGWLKLNLRELWHYREL